MDHASNDVLYKRFFELLDGGAWADLREGDTVQGAVLSVSERGAYIELGRKGPAYCHSNEMTVAKGVKAHEIVQPNSVRDFVITDIFGNGDVLVSMVEAEMAVTWARLKQLQELAITVVGKGESTNPNGLVVDVMGISGFLPKRFMDRNLEAEELIGKELQIKILEANAETERLIVAQKMMLSSGPGGDNDQEFKVGDVVEGKIVSIQPYGAFVNCGGYNDGLLHVSQISHDRVSNIEAVFSVNDTIKVMVLTHEKAKGRMNLSTRKLEPVPGDMLRNPQKVFEQADRMAALFKEQIKQAQELELSQNADGSLDASLDNFDL